MADTITIRLTGPLREYVDSMAGKDSLYENVSEYIRDLVRKDYDADAEERRKEQALVDRLNLALQASEDEYVPFDVEEIIAEAEQEYEQEQQAHSVTRGKNTHQRDLALHEDAMV